MSEALEAGRDLDRQIGEQLFGMHLYHYDKDLPEQCYYQLLDGEGEAVAPGRTFGASWGQRRTEAEA